MPQGISCRSFTFYATELPVTVGRFYKQVPLLRLLMEAKDMTVLSERERLQASQHTQKKTKGPIWQIVRNCKTIA